MQLAIAGWPIAGHSESLLDTITRRLRNIGKWLKDTLSQPGVPRHDYRTC
jgi:Lambda Phage CIII.